MADNLSSQAGIYCMKGVLLKIIFICLLAKNSPQMFLQVQDDTVMKVDWTHFLFKNQHYLL